MTAEQWRPVPGWETLYLVSDIGRVLSVRSRRMLTPWVRARGYSLVPLSGKGHFTHAYVHRLVLLAFVGPCPEGHECRHLDGNPRNNALANLAWGTKRENAVDMVRHGRCVKKLTDAQVAEIRALYAQGGRTQRAIAAEFGISRPYVGAICRGFARRRSAA